MTLDELWMMNQAWDADTLLHIKFYAGMELIASQSMTHRDMSMVIREMKVTSFCNDVIHIEIH